MTRGGEAKAGASTERNGLLAMSTARSDQRRHRRRGAFKRRLLQGDARLNPCFDFESAPSALEVDVEDPTHAAPRSGRRRTLAGADT
jgi:hypothetical protein